MAEPGSPAPAGGGFVLAVRDGRLSLAAAHHPRFQPLAIDWHSASLRRRVRAGRRQLLGRAVGLHRSATAEILDATAGMGEDALTLAGLGARVTLMERQPLVAALLRDALARLAASPADRALAARLEVLPADARALAELRREWDVVYLDPMYPGHDARDALPRKAMQVLRELTGGDPDADELLAPALAVARRRVVVKRPLHAPCLAQRVPDLVLRGTQARFDVYLRAGAGAKDPGCDA